MPWISIRGVKESEREVWVFEQLQKFMKLVLGCKDGMITITPSHSPMTRTPMVTFVNETNDEINYQLVSEITSGGISGFYLVPQGVTPKIAATKWADGVLDDWSRFDVRDPDVRAGLDYSTFPWNRCKAVLEPKEGHSYYGRCDLKKGHRSLHVLERGFNIVWFSTKVVDSVTQY
jgi:hypothetical protein